MSLCWRMTWESQHHKNTKPFSILILVTQEIMGWEWHQLDHMQIICTRFRQVTMAAPQHSVFHGMDVLPNSQSTASFVRSLWAGVQHTLDPSTETFWIGPVRQPRERRGVDRCVWCERYVGWKTESKLEQWNKYV